MGGNAADYLLVSDWDKNSLVWIVINDDLTMTHYNINRVDYKPRRLYNDKGILMVCGNYSKIHQYKIDGEALVVINAAVIPCSVTRHADEGHYLITELSL